MFIYQGTVFYAQMVLISTLMVQDATGEYNFQPIRGNREVWLIIETCCFYMYMIAAMIYILVR